MKKEIRSRLRIRAAALAKEPEPERERSADTELLEFTLSSGKYAIEVSLIREVYSLKDLTYLPGTPSHIAGIINVRGQIIPVVCLDKYFGLPDKGLNELNKVVILENKRMDFGILTNEILGINTVAPGDIHPVPSSISLIAEKFLKGITKDNIVILDGSAILEDEGLVVNEEV